jgi:hypothetical protein
LDPGSKIRDPGSRIQDPGWVKTRIQDLGSRIRDKHIGSTNSIDRSPQLSLFYFPPFLSIYTDNFSIVYRDISYIEFKAGGGCQVKFSDELR